MNTRINQLLKRKAELAEELARGEYAGTSGSGVNLSIARVAARKEVCRKWQLELDEIERALKMLK